MRCALPRVSGGELNVAVADPTVTLFTSAFELRRRLRVEPAPPPMLRANRVACALNARSEPGAATVISNLAICHAARASSCAEMETSEKTDEKQTSRTVRRRFIIVNEIPINQITTMTYLAHQTT